MTSDNGERTYGSHPVLQSLCHSAALPDVAIHVLLIILVNNVSRAQLHAYSTPFCIAFRSLDLRATREIRGPPTMNSFPKAAADLEVRPPPT